MINNLSKLVGYEVTSSKGIILQGFTGSANSSTTGAIVKLDSVYSISEGTVIAVDYDKDDLFVVTVQYTPTQLFRYCCLSSAAVKVNDYVIPSDLIGKSNKGQIRFEYCTTDVSLYPVRFNRGTYYKQDPSGVLLDIVQLYMSENAIGKFLSKSIPEITPTRQKAQNNLASLITGGRNG